ncbi:outer membrane protein assembly factor BamD [Candidatus Profftia sp. (ex Adelges kitamiensis)]|uniref:outer membrane protein assembly factor BamD n=1 Tax=Candidatus Profftia sp. (ex Adelges kitamiensis) TaxID=2864218 RepID=UPI001CE2E6B4|nr:outer membrane protein assembly factor BamD [Candidatus Profftia sp. (ex Adelges kitamiensis)]
MIFIKCLITIVTLSIVLIGCSYSKQKLTSNHIFFITYTTAQTNLQKGNFKTAIQQLELLDNAYPFGPYSQQVQLDLIYAYYKSSNFLIAQTYVDRFIRLNPSHPNIDYIFYMRGLIDMAMDENTLQEFFGIDRSDCNPEYAEQSFQDFSKLIKCYKHSEYASDAIRRLIYLMERLAKYDLSVARYYIKRRAYIATINRVEMMLRNYPNTQAVRNALPLMQYAYIKINLNSQANKVAKIITENNINTK